MATDIKEVGCGCLLWVVIILAGAYWWFSRDDNFDDSMPVKINSLQEANQLLNGFWSVDYEETFSMDNLTTYGYEESLPIYGEFAKSLPNAIYNFNFEEHRLFIYLAYEGKKQLMESFPYKIEKAKNNYVEIKSPPQRGTQKIIFSDGGKTIRIKVVGMQLILQRFSKNESPVKYLVLRKVNDFN